MRYVANAETKNFQQVKLRSVCSNLCRRIAEKHRNKRDVTNASRLALKVWDECFQEQRGKFALINLLEAI